MNVFCDFHHSGLFHSLQLLFEKRLGGNLYGPIGMDWYDQGFWKYYNHPDTRIQFLGLQQVSLAPRSRLNANRWVEDGIYYIQDAAEGYERKAVTFDKFFEMDWDIIIASVPQHLLPYQKLIADFKPKAKLIYQMGNEFFPIDFGLASNILSSTAPFSVPSGVNAVFYHQEFDLDVFKYTPPQHTKKIKSYLNWQCKTADYGLWQMYKSGLPDFEFIEHGTGGEHGVITGTKHLAESMAGADFIWHCKPGGDGFGHIIHNAFACGRPVIGRFSHYKGKLAWGLLEDGLTGLDLDKGTMEQNIRGIGRLAEEKRHIEMCGESYKRFCDIVDFDKEEKEIRVFLENLQ